LHYHFRCCEKFSGFVHKSFFVALNFFKTTRKT